MGKATATVKTYEQRMSMALGLVRQARLELKKANSKSTVVAEQIKSLNAVEEALEAVSNEK